MKYRSLLIAGCCLAGCAEHAASPPPVALAPAATAVPPTPLLLNRPGGYIGSVAAPGMATVSLGASSAAAGGARLAGGEVTLNFADADLRDTVARILGDILHVNYTIDPAVKGTATLRTAQPIEPGEALAALKEVLAQNSATLVTETTAGGALYHVEAAAGAAGAAGGEVVPLRYAAAGDLAKALAPFAGDNVKIGAAEGMNALVLSGDPAALEAVRQTIDAFDVDTLAGQSYALLPVSSGGAREYAQALQDALQADGNGALAGSVRVAPLTRMNAVLVIAHSSAAVAAAERVQRLLDRQSAATVRSWYVENLQNSRADDVANLLQQAFTPDHVTAQATSSNSSGANSAASNAGSLGSLTAGGSSAGVTPQNTTPAAATTTAAASGAANPVQGGTGSSQDGDQSQDVTQEMRIISDPQNNSVLVYATRTERETVEQMLRKIDIVPLQVRIDATIAEVTLNDDLKFGTQFFFKSAGPLTSSSGGINSFLSSAFSGTGSVTGFAIAGSGASQVALEALQQVTKVRVLSSPEVMALDNQQATLQVGELVPYLTSASQSTTGSSSVIDSYQYQQTGVTLQVTPRVNSGGQVTLDLNQNVSSVDSAITTSGINSPSFDQRSVRTRVVVQDGQTVGVAGLIRDDVSVSNQGVPYLKDVPWLGGLFGQQNNSRTRTELIVLITPHVVADQRSIDALTDDLRDTLKDAAAVPAEMARLPLSGSQDPNHSDGTP